VPRDGEALHVMALPRHGKIARLAAAPVSQASPFRPDRHGDPATSRNENTARGRRQVTGRVEAEPRMMSATSPRGGRALFGVLGSPHLCVLVNPQWDADEYVAPEAGQENHPSRPRTPPC
jgi:hypothetical protein